MKDFVICGTCGAELHRDELENHTIQKHFKKTNDVTFSKPMKSDKKDFKKCPYCKDTIPKSGFMQHIELEHTEQVQNVIRRLKVGIIIASSFVVISIGIVFGLLL